MKTRCIVNYFVSYPFLVFISVLLKTAVIILKLSDCRWLSVAITNLGITRTKLTAAPGIRIAEHSMNRFHAAVALATLWNWN